MKLYNRCKECDSLLWSNYSKEIGLCPECREGEDFLADLQSKDLEDQLED